VRVHGRLESALSDLPNRGDRRLFDNLLHILKVLRDDERVLATADRLEQAVSVFDELRECFHFPLSERKPVRRSSVPRCEQYDSSVSGQKLAVFMDRLQEIINHPGNTDQSRDARIITDYCEKYRDYLGVRVLKMPDGMKNITVPRTNNACEIGFRNKKHMWRRTLGTKKVGRKLQSANPAEMLVANLNNPLYVDCVCGGDIRSLPDLFAQCSADAAMLAKQRRATPDAHMKTTKRNLRAADVLAEIVGAIGRHAAALF